MSVVVLPQTLTSTFLVCGTGLPAPAGISTVVKTVTDTYTQTYCVTLPAACPTGAWLATYTVAEVCTGNPADFVTPACPANFVVTTVACDACDQKNQVITCPNALATESSISVLGHNGVMATVQPDQAVHPAMPSPGPAGGVAQGTGVPPSPKAPLVTAGAPSLKTGLALAGAIALAAGQFLLA